MIEMEIRNKNAKILTRDRNLKKLVRELCTFQTAYKRKNSDRWYKDDNANPNPMYLDSRDGIEIFAGWAGIVASQLSDNGYHITVVDKRNKPTRKVAAITNSVNPNYFKPRKYQQHAVDQILKSSRGIISLGTAGGKTVLAAMLIKKIGLHTVFLVPNENLAMQACNTFKQWFGDDNVGLVGIGKFEHDKPVVVATVQTMWSKMKRSDNDVDHLIKRTDLLMIDECHHVGASDRFANTWFHVCQSFDCYYRIGLTATPGRENTLGRRLLEAATGRVIVDISVKELTENGYITPVNVFMIPVDTGFSFVGLWNKNYKNNILKNKTRNELICDLASEFVFDKKKVLIVVNRVEEHGAELEKEIKSRIGDKAYFMHGKTSTKDRIAAMEKFQKGKILCMIGTVFNEGVDVPTLDVIINAGAGKSETLMTQRVGRVLRLSPGKKAAVMIDFIDNDKKAHLPKSRFEKTTFTEQRGMLYEHSISRMNTYFTEGHSVYNVVSIEGLDLENPNLESISEVIQVGWEREDVPLHHIK